MYVNDLVAGQLLSLLMICCVNAVPYEVRKKNEGLYRLFLADAGIAVGLFYCGRSAVLLFVSAGVACVLLCPITGRHGPRAAITWQFIFLTGSHLLSSWFPDGSYVNSKVIMPLMMLTQKVTDLAMIQYDGYKTSGGHDSWKRQGQVPSHPWWRLMAQLGYMFSAPGLLTGPLYRFTEYGGLPRKSAPKVSTLLRSAVIDR
ncbi:lysophospholipid acyltransferase 6-like [Branchiostoma floridae x Branchiostoma belcheri]